MIHKQRLQVAVRPIPADKMPYIVRGKAYTVLHLTSEQAAKRFDLIPQFQRIPLGSEPDHV